MAERPVALEGLNLVLLLAQGLLWVAALLLLLGPGRGALGAARSEVSVWLEREDDWQADFGDLEELSDAERLKWQADYAALRDFGAPNHEEPELTAWVASELRAPSVKGLEVIAESDEDEAAEPLWELRSPSAAEAIAEAEGIAFHQLSVRVRFDALYADLSQILSRIESAGSALSLRGLRVRRQAAEVRVELELGLWAQQEGRS